MEARVKATISPKIAGRICEALVDQGDRVAAGQLLIRLDQEELSQQVEMAQAGVALLLMIILGMGGIYRGLIADALVLLNHVDADLWLVQRNTRGPFAEPSRVPRALDLPRVSAAVVKVAALLGPSGSGKTTLLSAMGLVSLPTAGSVFIDGQQVVDGPAATADLRIFRRRIGYVFQKANLVSFLTAQENVLLPLLLNHCRRSAARRAAWELLDRLGVANRASHLPQALSSGQQQRVAIARALANGPSVILADEPTAALDSQRGRQVMELFREAARQSQAAVMIVTHDHRTLDVFDRIYEMEDGRLKPAGA